MWKRLLLPLLLLPALCGAQPRVGRLLGPEGNTVCSVTYVAPSLALTGKHCFRLEEPISADGKPFIRHPAGPTDVQFLIIPEETQVRTVKFRCGRLRLGEEVRAYGYAYGDVRAVIYGRYAGAAPDGGNLFDLNLIAGMSGGPIIDRQGRIVGMVSRTLQDGPGSPNALAYSPRMCGK